MAIKLDIRDPRRQPSMRTTISLPLDLLTAADQVVEAGLATSRNDLLAEALWRELRRLDDEARAQDYAAMAEDEDYLAEAAEIAEAFAESDWEALQLAEAELDATE